MTQNLEDCKKETFFYRRFLFFCKNFLQNGELYDFHDSFEQQGQLLPERVSKVHQFELPFDVLAESRSQKLLLHLSFEDCDPDDPHLLSPFLASRANREKLFGVQVLKYVLHQIMRQSADFRV
jgi:hypothetical protein